MDAYLRYGNVVEIKGTVMLFLMFTRKKITDSVIDGLKVKSHLFERDDIWNRSWFRTDAEATDI